MRVMGVDPGTFGAVAVFDSENVPRVTVYELTNVALRVGNKSKTRLDLDGVWSLMLGVAGAFDPHIAILEEVNGYGGNEQGTAASAGVLMSTAGALEMALIASETPRQISTSRSRSPGPPSATRYRPETFTDWKPGRSPSSSMETIFARSSLSMTGNGSTIWQATVDHSNQGG